MANVRRHVAALKQNVFGIFFTSRLTTRYYIASPHLRVGTLSHFSSEIDRNSRNAPELIQPQVKPSDGLTTPSLVVTEGKEELERGGEVIHHVIPNSMIEFWSEHTRAPTYGQRMFANVFFENPKYPPKLIFKAREIYQAKHTGVPEIAVIGRANVGKSSLLNALLGRKVASTSAQPGHTRALHAWGVGGPDGIGGEWRLTVLDMPGYGKMIRKEWGDTIKKYLDQRKELRRIYVLINAEHGIKTYDQVAIQLLRESGIPHQIVLTKTDKLFTKYGGCNLKKARLRVVMSESNQQKAAKAIRQRVAEVKDISKAKRGELPAFENIVAVSSTALDFPTPPPNKKNTLGISALRWSILDAVGIRSAATYKDETQMTYDAS